VDIVDAELTPKVIQASNKFRWERKINQIFWRGSMTGGSFNLTNYHIFPRSLAVRFSLINPSILNARFIVNGQADLKTMKEMKKFGYFGNSLPIEKSIAYKYLLDIDGNSCCYSRTYWALLSNSVVIKMRSDNVQWYYDLLKPDINYISVNSDLSDLNQIFNFLNNNDLEAQEMANRATNIAKLELSYEATLAYFYVLLKRFEFYLH
jgi:hypothetical protein